VQFAQLVQFIFVLQFYQFLQSPPPSGKTEIKVRKQKQESAKTGTTKHPPMAKRLVNKLLKEYSND
jgi:hypothetical protein